LKIASILYKRQTDQTDSSIPAIGGYLADFYLGSHIDWAVVFETLPEPDSFVAYAERLRARPAYIKAKAIDAALMPQS
jgi:hypothetical protein